MLIYNQYYVIIRSDLQVSLFGTPLGEEMKQTNEYQINTTIV